MIVKVINQSSMCLFIHQWVFNRSSSYLGYSQPCELFYTRTNRGVKSSKTKMTLSCGLVSATEVIVSILHSWTSGSHDTHCSSLLLVDVISQYDNHCYHKRIVCSLCCIVGPVKAFLCPLLRSAMSSKDNLINNNSQTHFFFLLLNCFIPLCLCLCKYLCFSVAIF